MSREDAMCGRGDEVVLDDVSDFGWEGEKSENHFGAGIDRLVAGRAMW